MKTFTCCFQAPIDTLPPWYTLTIPSQLERLATKQSFYDMIKQWNTPVQTDHRLTITNPSNVSKSNHQVFFSRDLSESSEYLYDKITGKVRDLSMSGDKIHHRRLSDNKTLSTRKVRDLSLSGGQVRDLSSSGRKVRDLSLSGGQVRDLSSSDRKVHHLSVSGGKVHDLSLSSIHNSNGPEKPSRIHAPSRLVTIIPVDNSTSCESVFFDLIISKLKERQPDMLRLLGSQTISNTARFLQRMLHMFFWPIQLKNKLLMRIENTT